MSDDNFQLSLFDDEDEIEKNLRVWIILLSTLKLQINMETVQFLLDLFVILMAKKLIVCMS